MEEKEDAQDLQVNQDLQMGCYHEKYNGHEESSSQNLKQQELVEQQNRSILVTCNILEFDVDIVHKLMK